MSFAWVSPKEIYLLEAFPEVVMIGTTEKTNNEKRPLLTAGGKDSHGNMFIFLQVLCLINSHECFGGFFQMYSQVLYLNIYYQTLK